MHTGIVNGYGYVHDASEIELDKERKRVYRLRLWILLNTLKPSLTMPQRKSLKNWALKAGTKQDIQIFIAALTGLTVTSPVSERSEGIKPLRRNILIESLNLNINSGLPIRIAFNFAIFYPIHY